MKGIVDRFEEDLVIIETEQGMINVPKGLVAAEVREGQAVQFIEGQWEIDREASSRLRREIADLAEELWED